MLVEGVRHPCRSVRHSELAIAPLLGALDAPLDLADVVEIVAETDAIPVIGGKSFGGRVASMIADEQHAAGAVRGLVCLGYPFHPMGKPEQLRTAHLAELATPTLICQGERDIMGSRAEVKGYALSPAIRIAWAPDGDHDLKPRKASGHSFAENLAAAAEATAAAV